MSSHGGLHGHLRGFNVANFPNKNHIWILPQNAAQNIGERVPLLVINWNLRATLSVILNRILNGDGVERLHVNLAQT